MTQEAHETPQHAVEGVTAHDTATAADWLSLASRCEAAKGADRGLDQAIQAAWTQKRHHTGTDTLPRLTGSLDAITALIERELPGWAIKSGKTRNNEFLSWATVWGHEDTQITATTRARTEALARCAAFCRAMHAKGARS
jgi:hypothetical protein